MKEKKYIFNKFVDKQAFLSFALNSIGVLLLFIQQIVFTRTLGAKDYGVFSFIQAIFTLSGVFTNFGLSTLSSRELGSLENDEFKKGFYRFSHLLLVLLNFVFGIIIIFYCTQFKILDETSQITSIIILSTIYFYLKSLFELLSIQFQAEGLTFASKLTSHIIPIAISILGLFILKLFRLNGLYYFLEFLVYSSIASLFIIYLIKKPIYFEMKKINARYNIKKWIRSGVLLMLLTAMYIALGRLNAFIVGINENEKYVGYYSICLSLSNLVVFGLNAANQVFAPQIAKYSKEGNHIEFQKIIDRSAKLGFISTLFFVVFLILFGKNVLSIFGSEFSDAYIVLNILSIGYLGASITGPVGLSLTMSGKEKYVLYATGIAAVINLALSLIMVKIWGYVGVAIANSIGLILLNIPLAIFVKRRFNYRTYVTFTRI